MYLRFIALITLLCIIPLTASAADYAPSLLYSTVLNGVQLTAGKGEFRLNNIQAAFLPDPGSSSYYPYNPDDGGNLWSILRTADGDELWRFDWYAKLQKAPYWLLNSYKASNLKSGESTQGWIGLAQPGEYVLDFYLDSGKFYTFSFGINKLGSDDPFDGDPLYFLSGDWEDWGYFYYRNADASQSLAFKVWLQNHAIGADRSVKPELKVMRGSKTICTSRQGLSLRLQPKWNRFDLDMIFPMEGTSGGGYFKAQDLVNTDGDYKLVLTLDGKEYGSWKFSITGGKFQPAGRTVRDTADPLTFVEGGKDAFWYGKE